MLSNFDVWSQAGGDRPGDHPDVINTSVTDGVVTIDFIRRVENAKVKRHRDHPAGCGGSRSGDRAGRQRICLREQTNLDANPAADLEGYRVYRSSSATGTYTRLNTALVTGTSYADTAAPAGATSYYQLTAVDLSGNESARSVDGGGDPPGGRAPDDHGSNAGGPAVTASGTTWAACSAVGAACSNRVTGGYAYSENDTITGIPAGMSNAIFQSEWNGGAVGTGVVPVGQRAFGFAVPVANGAYQVRLHFAELNKSGAGQRTFDVRLENSTVLSNFDIWAQAGGIDRAITRSFNTSVTDGVMTIDFIRRVQNAKVSAIEIIQSADPRLPVLEQGGEGVHRVDGPRRGWAVGVEVVPRPDQPYDGHLGLQRTAHVAGGGRDVHQRPVVGGRPAVDGGVRLRDPQPLRGEGDVVVDQRRGRGRGEELVVDVGEQPDAVVAAQRAQAVGRRPATAASGHRLTSASTPSAGSASIPSAAQASVMRCVAGSATDTTLRSRAGRPCCAGPRRRTAARRSTGQPSRQRVERRRPAGARVDQRREQVERDDQRGRHGSASALRTSSTGCIAWRSVPWWICWRQETPVAATTVSSGSARTAGNSRSLADLHRDVVVLGLEAERPGHAAAAGVELDDLGAGDPVSSATVAAVPTSAFWWQWPW